ncbi:mitochondrial sulfhydryl oxidase [Encephalitozoon cuniculi EcunIII-L]|uniref:Sulfhydryl oxidase n=1 Tax=Encephalitozoon cuniculi TaxID=6035 RepID=M1KKH1_ENCCN|nr:protein of the ERV1/ALR family [Encephalitozoon cuniculi]KMV66003.1 mitochondrial sulfhydryl oxidase [Encephalitozoon cuniculi EcunIII-L]UYI27701.1 FAD-linked sulfhydryl oxidase [Encephalitozoon cuniculi]
MKRKQSYGRILVVLAAAWVTYRCYGLMVRDREGKVSSELLGGSGKSENPRTEKLSKKEIRERLGRSTWTLLHTMGARYPAFPTYQQKKDTLSFIHLLSSVFPCGECTKHFQKLLSDYPPRVGSNEEFKTWLCEVHNVVNRRLGKTVVDCRTVDEIWDCGCEA